MGRSSWFICIIANTKLYFMASICDFLKDILPDDAAKIQAWAGVITSGFAVYALFSWKQQKKYDQNILALSKRPMFKSLFWNEIFEIQGSIDELQDNIKKPVVDYKAFHNTAKKMADITSKYEKEFLNLGYHSIVELIKRNQMTDTKFIDIHNFYIKTDQIHNEYINGKILTLIVEYYDKQKKVTPINIDECIKDFQIFSIDHLNIAVEKFHNVFEESNQK